MVKLVLSLLIAVVSASAADSFTVGNTPAQTVNVVVGPIFCTVSYGGKFANYLVHYECNMNGGGPPIGTVSEGDLDTSYRVGGNEQKIWFHTGDGASSFEHIIIPLPQPAMPVPGTIRAYYFSIARGFPTKFGYYFN